MMSPTTMPQVAEDEEADEGVTQAPKSKHKRSSVARASILGDRVNYDLLTAETWIFLQG
jgi:hypothetical protein